MKHQEKVNMPAGETYLSWEPLHPVSPDPDPSIVYYKTYVYLSLKKQYVRISREENHTIAARTDNGY